jgi:hypothetical protein
VPDPDWDDVPAKSARKVRLGSLLRRGLRRFSYLYDFGDNWEHLIEVKRKIPLLPGEEVPILLAGQRRCPPEDVGGLGGFEEFLAAMADPNHPEHGAMMTWHDGPFDPDDIDLERINRRLAVISQRRRTATGHRRA